MIDGILIADGVRLLGTVFFFFFFLNQILYGTVFSRILKG